MNDLLYILTLTTPIFSLILIGYVVVNAGLLSKDHICGFGWFLLHFSVPAAIFKALSSRPLQDILHYNYLLIFGLGSLLSFLILFIIAIAKNKSLTECSIFGLGGSLSNSLLIGLPVITQIFGDDALVPFSLTLIIENFLILPLALALADIGQHERLGFFKALSKSLPTLLKNPIVIALGLGLLSAATSIQPPHFIGVTVDMLAMTVGGLSLFTIGGMLVGIKVHGMLADLSIIVLGKLVLHPLMILMMILLFPPLPSLFQSVAIILATLPMFGVYAVIGMRYKLGDLCSAVMLPTILLSFISINVAIWLLA